MRIDLEKILSEIEELENVFERRRKRKLSPKEIWKIYPREQILRKGHIRVTKHGVELVEPHLHPYPKKLGEEVPSRKRRRGILEEGEKHIEDLRREALNDLLSCYI